MNSKYLEDLKSSRYSITHYENKYTLFLCKSLAGKGGAPCTFGT